MAPVPGGGLPRRYPGQRQPRIRHRRCLTYKYAGYLIARGPRAGGCIKQALRQFLLQRGADHVRARLRHQRVQGGRRRDRDEGRPPDRVLRDLVLLAGRRPLDVPVDGPQKFQL